MDRDYHQRRDEEYRWRKEAPVEDTAPRRGLDTWRWESGGRERASCNRRQELTDNLQERGRASPWEGLPEVLARAACDQSRGSSPLHGQEYPREEGEWAAGDGRWERGGWPRDAGGPQLEGRHLETCQMEGRIVDAHWEPGHPPDHGEMPGAGGPAPRDLGGLPGLTPELGRVADTWAAGQAAEQSQ